MCLLCVCVLIGARTNRFFFILVPGDNSTWWTQFWFFLPTKNLQLKGPTWIWTISSAFYKLDCVRNKMEIKLSVVAMELRLRVRLSGVHFFVLRTNLRPQSKIGRRLLDTIWSDCFTQPMSSQFITRIVTLLPSLCYVESVTKLTAHT